MAIYNFGKRHPVIAVGTYTPRRPRPQSPSGSFSPRRAARLAAMRRMEAAIGWPGHGKPPGWLRGGLMGGAAPTPPAQLPAGVLRGLAEPSISSAESSAPDAWRRLYGSVGDLFNRS